MISSYGALANNLARNTGNGHTSLKSKGIWIMESRPLPSEKNCRKHPDWQSNSTARPEYSALSHFTVDQTSRMNSSSFGDF